MNNIQIKLNELRSLSFEESYTKFEEILKSQYNIAIDDSMKTTERIMVVIECDDNDIKVVCSELNRLKK